MWIPWQWATRSNERAISNAREATTACSRRRLEHEGVAFYLITSLSEATESAKHPA